MIWAFYQLQAYSNNLRGWRRLPHNLDSNSNE